MSLPLPAAPAPRILRPGFLYLSYEIRQAIYQAIFVHNHKIPLLSFNGRLVSDQFDVNIAALQLCKQVSLEALQVLYTANHFILHWGSLCHEPPLNQTFSPWLTHLEVYNCVTELHHLIAIVPPVAIWDYPKRIRNLTATLPGLEVLFFRFDHAGLLLTAALDISVAIPRCQFRLDTPELRLQLWILRAPNNPKFTAPAYFQTRALDRFFRRTGSQLIDMFVHRATTTASTVGFMLTASHAPSLRRIVLNGPMLGSAVAKLLQHRCTLGDCGWQIVRRQFNPEMEGELFTGHGVELRWGYRGPPPGHLQGSAAPVPAIVGPVTNLAVLWPGWTSAGVSRTQLDAIFSTQG